MSAAYTDGERFSVYTCIRRLCDVFVLILFAFTVVFSLFPSFLQFFCKFVLGQFILPAIWFANVEMCEIKVGVGFFVYDRIDTVIFFRISQ